MAETFTQEDVENAPELSGKFERKTQALTELERAVAAHQGLLEDDGTLKDEAIRKEPTEVQLPPGIPMPVSLESISDDADKITEEIQSIRGEHAPEAAIDEELQVDSEGLAPPDVNNRKVENIDTVENSAPDELDLRSMIATSDDPVVCAHCGWDQREAFKTPKHSEEDKLAFIRHIMGTTGRFYKTVDLLGGNIKLTLRSRSQTEVDMIMNYTRDEMKKDNLVGVGDLTAQIQRYHIAASVHEIAFDKGREKFPFLSEIAATDDKSAVEIMDDNVFGNERSTAMYGMVTAEWLGFERLYGWLASHAHDKDFWKAVAGARS